MPTCTKSGPPIARVRSRGSANSPQEFRVLDYNASGQLTSNALSGYTSPIGEWTVMEDRVVPCYNERISRGEVLFNPMTKVRTSLESSSNGASLVSIPPAVAGAINTTTGDRLLILIGGKCDLNQVGPKLRAKSLNLPGLERAISVATTATYRPPSEASSLVTLAELHKTMRLVPDLLKNWSQLFQKLNRVSVATRTQTALQNSKSLSLSNLRALERTLTETWLAMRFGVRPLISDTLGVMKVLKKVYENSEKIRMTSRGQASLSDSLVENLVIDAGCTRNPVTCSTHSEYAVRAMQLWEFKLEALRDLGFSISSIPEAAIDLVRFSFVFNWVANVNDFFASLGSSMDPGVKSFGGCYVVRELSTSTWQSTGMSSLCNTWGVLQPQSGIVTATTETTRRIVGLPSPKLVVRGDWSRFLSDFRLLDAIALSRQQLRGRNVQVLANLSARTGHI